MSAPLRHAIRGRWLLAALLSAFGCTRRAAERPHNDSTTASPVPADSAKVSSTEQALVQPEVLPAAVRTTCGSAAGIVREGLALDIKREDGGYFDSFQGARRVGCRLRAEGSFAELKDSAGPVSAIENAFTRHGWKGDPRYMADGPDGSDVGLRRLDQLCIVLGRWDGGDDGDTTSAPPTAEENRFEAIVECARDVASNKDTGVPDSIWRIASNAGLDPSTPAA